MFGSRIYSGPTSITVEFRVRPGEAVQQRQCQFLCFNDKWRSPSTDNFEALVGYPPARYDCHLLSDVSHNCIGEYMPVLVIITYIMEGPLYRTYARTTLFYISWTKTTWGWQLNKSTELIKYKN